MNRLDSALREQEQKPLLDRDYAGIVEGYTRIAKQPGDVYARNYALARLRQIEGASQTVAMVNQVRTMGDALTSERRAARLARQEIEPPPRVIGGGFNVTGELRKSMIYQSPVGPRRLRLVGDDGVRTIAYVDVPREAGIDVTRFLGRRVGVRARDVRLQTEDVDPLVIYVASELVLLDAAPASNTGGGVSPPPGSDAG